MRPPILVDIASVWGIIPLSVSSRMMELPNDLLTIFKARKEIVWDFEGVDTIFRWEKYVTPL